MLPRKPKKTQNVSRLKSFEAFPFLISLLHEPWKLSNRSLVRCLFSGRSWVTPIGKVFLAFHASNFPPHLHHSPLHFQSKHESRTNSHFHFELAERTISISISSTHVANHATNRKSNHSGRRYQTKAGEERRLYLIKRSSAGLGEWKAIFTAS